MTEWTSVGPSVLASFMASMVEFVEALTIVLAVGVVRGWRSALLGSAAGAMVLVVLVLALGRSLSAVPLPVLQLVVGLLLLMFGLRWLRKAILRAGDVLPLHDEADAFAKETQALRNQGESVRTTIDGVAFLTTFKTVMLEGIEVVFIVIALGASGKLLVPAAVGAGLALLVVILLGVWLHRPLSNVPENSLKFGVGVMLSAFGAFWVGEGIGLGWPGGDWAIPLLIAVFLVSAAAMVRACRHVQRVVPPKATAPLAGAASSAGAGARVVAELFGLFVDDGWLAAGVLLCVLVLWRLEVMHPISAVLAGVLFLSGLLLVLGVSALRRARA